ncbi:MAG: acetate--CoA ligase family protein, partial [Thermoguttaceae bacterium]|nr:acetate--CoA ligase family protein [Thermoguttaceae bacterium]
DVKHKFDAGGVLLNIKGAEAAAAGFDQIYANIAKNVPGAKIDSILIEEMAPKGTEVILGCNRDPKFGPLVMFGMGGTTAELMKDVQFRLAPTSKYFLHSMLENTKVYKLMNNYRGLGQHDLAALEDALIRLSVLVSENPEIAELDINPLIVHAEGLGCSVADSRIVLKKVK